MCMWFLWASAQAFDPSIGGGMGIGLMNPASRLLGTPGAGATGSVEVTELIEPIPWLGVGVDTVVGLYPKQCDTCTGYPALRQGFGPVFRQRAGFVQVGGRYAIGTISLQRQSKLRPFAKTALRIPAGDLDFRVALWAEGFPATEIGLAIELGWWLEGGAFRVSRAD